MHTAGRVDPSDCAVSHVTDGNAFQTVNVVVVAAGCSSSTELDLNRGVEDTAAVSDEVRSTYVDGDRTWRGGCRTQNKV